MENWMENLDPSLKNKPLIHLAIPGSHDCMTYTISGTSEMSPDNEPIVKSLLKVFGRLGRRYMHKWCITQDMDVLAQLNVGIRYLDFRVAAKSDGNVYFCHGLYGSEVSPCLGIISNFLDENKGEVVIMDFQHFYDFTMDIHRMLINKLIKGTFGSKLCPYSSKTTDELGVTLNWMLKNGYRVIVIYRDYEIECQSIEGLWPGPAWPTPWPNTSKINHLMRFVQEKLATRDPNKGFVTQCLLTPDATSLTLSPWSSLKSKCSKPVHKKLPPWLKKQHPGPHGVNVVLADYVSTGNFYDLVIGLNNFFVEQ